MQFELSEEQQELQAFVRELCEQRATSAQIRETIESDQPYDVELWSILCEQMGAASLAIPEEFGGTGFSARETHIVIEQLGRGLTPSPFLGSVAIAAQAILAAGDKETSEQLLPSIASGKKIATLAWASPTGRWAPHQVNTYAHKSGENWEVTGTIGFVLDGSYADVVLLIAQTDLGPALFLVGDTATLTRVSTPSMDQTISLATLEFNSTPARLISADAGVLETIRLVALTALSASQVGTASRALETTVEYSLQRTQFGRKIGSFQALKHRMADMYVHLETMRSSAYAASWAQAEGDSGWPGYAILAKATASEALAVIAGEMIQLHGGIAITWEHDAHLVFKRAHATAQLFGTSSELRREHGTKLGLVS